MIEYPKRKRPAHGICQSDHQPTIIYATFCTKYREPWLASDDVHELLCDVWGNATEWLVGRYVIMPDHLHLFAGMSASATVSYENWTAYWKSQFSKRNCRLNRRWQTDNWSTRVRNQAMYLDKTEYMLDNPVRAGLVKRREDWPFQGQIFELPWD